MSNIAIGKPVPDFALPATGGKTINLSNLKGKHVVLYFYPKDNTPGCTREGQDFRDHYEEFSRFDTVILGISRDSLNSHEKFKEEQGFQFDLLTDEDEHLCRLFDVIKPKNMYGKEVMGVERSTFLIDKEGVLRREWRKVKVEGHVAEVLEALAAL
ncbi:MAG: peroxiredoxin [Pseudomonadota bacterium]